MFSDDTHRNMAEAFRAVADAIEKGGTVNDENLRAALCELQAGLVAVLKPVSGAPSEEHYGERA